MNKNQFFFLWNAIIDVAEIWDILPWFFGFPKTQTGENSQLESRSLGHDSIPPKNRDGGLLYVYLHENPLVSHTGLQLHTIHKVSGTFGPQNHEKWWFYALRIWLIGPKNEGNVASNGRQNCWLATFGRLLSVESRRLREPKMQMRCEVNSFHQMWTSHPWESKNPILPPPTPGRT